MWIELLSDNYFAHRFCLNPYSNGMWIELRTVPFEVPMVRLNPYSNGMWIEQRVCRLCRFVGVLILILMECG